MPRHDHLGISLALAALTACGSEATTGDEGPSNGRPSAVVAVSFDAPLEGEVDRVAIAVTADGDSLVDERVATDGATPFEVDVPRLAPGTKVQARAIAYRGDDELFRQVELTEAMSGRTLLIAMRMNDECWPERAHRDVSCEGSTCRQGVCASPFVDPRDLDDYHASWSKPPSGSCGGLDQLAW